MSMMMMDTSTPTVKRALDTFGSEREHAASERTSKRERWERTMRTAPVELIREGDVHYGLHERITARALVFGHVMIRTQFSKDWMDLGPMGEARCLIETMIIPGEYDPIYEAGRAA